MSEQESIIRYFDAKSILEKCCARVGVSEVPLDKLPFYADADHFPDKIYFETVEELYMFACGYKAAWASR